MSETRPLAVALSAAMLMSSTAFGASFGHSRIVSGIGEPLRIDVPVTQVSADDQRFMRVSAATPLEWVQAGLMPPVDLHTLDVRMADGLRPGTKVIHVSSTQVLERPVADLLLNVRTASGQQQIQVSILAPAGKGIGYSTAAVPGSAAKSGTRASGNQARADLQARQLIHVKRGDTLWAIAQHNAVPGVSIYQMMVALHRANPGAFINKNLNLIKAGATLRVPGHAALTAISDREARRIFAEHVQAYARYRAGLSAQATEALKGSSAAQGPVSEAAVQPPASVTSEPRDQVRLSSAQPGADQKADTRVATRKGIADSQERVTTLQENVKDLNQALRAQGEAAKDAVVEGASSLGKAVSDAADAVAGAPAGNSAGQQQGASSVSGAQNPAASAAATGTTGAAAAKAGSAATSSASAGTTRAASSETSSSKTSSSESSSKGTSFNGTPSAGASPTGSGQASGASSGLDGVAGSGAAAGAALVPGGADGAGGNANSAMATGRSATPSGSSAATHGGSATAGATSSAASNGSAGSNGTAAAGSTTVEGALAGAAALAGAPAKSEVPASGGTQQPGKAVAPSGPDSRANDAGEHAPDSKEQAMSWFQEHTLGVVTGLLALLVLVIAWVLRRANSARDDDADDHNGLITEAMVKAKLDKINLDLREPPVDSSPGQEPGQTGDHASKPPSGEPAPTKT